MLTGSHVLRQSQAKREYFDPSNQAHLDSMDVFLRTGNWGAVQFYPELPFIEVPATVLAKYTMFIRGVQRENADEHAARLSAKPLVVPTPPESAESRKARLAKVSAKTIDICRALRKSQ